MAAAQQPYGTAFAPPPRAEADPIGPLEYRHLRAYGAMRIFGGSVAAGAGIICLSYKVYGSIP